MEHVAALSTHVIPPHELIPREHRARFPFNAACAVVVLSLSLGGMTPVGQSNPPRPPLSLCLPLLPVSLCL